MTVADATENTARTIVIVGAGPRGVAVVERCAAASLRPELFSRVHSAGPVRVVLVDPHVDRGGSVWRSDQTHALFMNTTTCQTTMYPDASTAPKLGPGTGEALTFDEFASRRGLVPTDFAPRAVHGEYLAHVLEESRRSADPRVIQIETIHGTVCDVSGEPGQAQRVTVRCAGDPARHLREVGERRPEELTIEADAVVLALGHLVTEPSPRLAALHAFARDNGLASAMPNNPLDVDYAQFDNATSIAIEGMGLNFFDALGMLTSRWGGEFVANADGSLTYHASGREPHLYVGSRSGQLYRAKPDCGDAMPEPFDLQVLTDEQRSILEKEQGGVGYETDIVPLIREELRQALLAGGFESFATDEAITHMLFPLGRRVGEAEHAHERTVRALEEMVREASAPVDERWLLTYRVLSALREQVNALVANGALEAESFLREWLGFGQNSFAAWRSGPPLFRSRQLLALVEAGLVTFVGPGMSVKARPGEASGPDGLGEGGEARETGISGAHFEVQGGGDSPVYRADAFLAAHLPSVNLGAYTSELVCALRERGEVREARLGAHGVEEGLVTGSIDLAETMFGVREDGSVDTTRLFLGVPVTQAQPGSAISAEPGTGAQLLINAERAAMLALGIAR